MAYAAKKFTYIGDNIQSGGGGGDVEAASVAEVWAGTVGDKYVPPSVQSLADEFQDLTYAATMTWTPSTQGYHASILLGGNLNLTIGGPHKLGRFLVVLLKSNTGGSKSFAYDSNVIDMSGQTISLSTAASKTDVLRLQCVDASGNGKYKGTFIKAG